MRLPKTRRKNNFDRYALIEDNTVSKVVFCPNDSPPSAKGNFVKISKDLTINIGDKVEIQDNKVSVIPPEKKSWWKFS